MFRLLAMSLLFMAVMMVSVAASQSNVDKDSGLIVAPGWETVRGNCMACHSARLITQNSGSRNTWEGIIRWMQDTQGLWAFDAKTEDAILTYLSTNYGIKEGARRAPLDRSLMPAS